LLSPPSLSGDGVFDRTIKTLLELGIAAIGEGEQLELKHRADTVDDFGELLRALLLTPERNSDLASHPTLGNRDLTIVLCFFLSGDPLGPPITEKSEDFMTSAFSVDSSNPTPNSTRWNAFGRWALALGLGAPPLFPALGARPMTPDCTAAVRDVLRKNPNPGPAIDTVRLVRREIPVLPGGVFATDLDLPDPGEASADAALSFALLRGETEGWLRLDRFADASRSVTLTDRDQPNRRVSDIVYQGDLDV
jgi:hypothetical protein